MCESSLRPIRRTKEVVNVYRNRHTKTTLHTFRKSTPTENFMSLFNQVYENNENVLSQKSIITAYNLDITKLLSQK